MISPERSGERRLLLFHDPDEAARWQEALDAAGLPADCLAFEEPFKDDRGYWQPPRVFWKDIIRDGVTKHLYWICGMWFRTNIDNNFDGGGNHNAYPEISPDCEYVEANNDDSQVDSEIIGVNHETPEDIRMDGDWQKNYEEAHGHSITEERRTREPYRDPRVISDPSKPVDENASRSDAPDLVALVGSVIRRRRGR